mmetsp:Transcript_3299/g.5082  ORF Transcript_3299/g.5082 Transcript_3299/m.5082 type:complete len:270 (+) Transcript_3299:29-838(+)
MSFPYNYPKTEDFYYQGMAYASQMNQSNLLSQKMFQALKLQGELMTRIIDQNKQLQEKLIEIRQEIDKIQGNVNSEHTSLKIPSKQTLLHLICPDAQEFMFSLELKGGIPNPICKGRYFGLKVQLMPLSSRVFPREEKLRLEVKIYTAEDPPKEISHNMNGLGILRGQSTSILAFNTKENRHTANFKIQLNEVTSHFLNGWVFLVVVPTTESDYIKSSSYGIQPLVVKHLVVKAKETTCKRWREKGKVRDIMPQPSDALSCSSQSESES